MDILKLIVVCSLLVILLAFTATYIITNSLIKPLKDMALAANEIEKGNYERVIQVNTNDEVGTLAKAFNKMSKAVGSLDRMHHSFVSSVSHELKTPMTTMSGFVDGILDGTIKPENQTKYLQIVSDETKRLSRLVNSMLQLSRLDNDATTLNTSEFNLTEMVIQILFSFEARVESKNLDIRGLDTAQRVIINADKDLIYQVMYNLVENAIKFTPESGYIEVNIAYGKQRTADVSILNSGAGLSQQELSRIFERFYKTDRSRSEDKTGMGFGLYIVKKIVGLHNGNINASSVPGEYTCFEVVLPLKQQPVINEE